MIGGIPANVRFCPTVSGDLHVGHLYTALVNEAEARAGNGEMFVRFDDTQPYWNIRMGWRGVRECMGGMLRDLSWFGLGVGMFVSQSEMHSEVEGLLARYCRGAGIPLPLDCNGERYFPEVVGAEQQYPYTVYKTAEKVIMDNLQGVTLLIRGADLLDEFSLYCYFCDAFGLFMPRQVFLPRLRGLNGAEMSKTQGGYSVAAYRANGYSAASLRDLLSRSVLMDPKGSWCVSNVKSEPVVVEDV